MSRNITGERIAELLREKDMTQRELAKRTGVTFNRKAIKPQTIP